MNGSSRRSRGPCGVAALAACLLLLAGASAFSQHAPGAGTLEVEARIPLGSVRGRIDHLAVDLDRKRLFVAELGNDTVGVVDLTRSAVQQTLQGFSEPQGIAYVPSVDAVVVANGGDGSARILAGGTLAEVGRVKLGSDADNVRVAPDGSHVFVGYGAGAIAELDLKSRRKVGEIGLKGHPESFRVDAPGRYIYVNVPETREVAVLDRHAGRQASSWSMGDLQANYPMVLDSTSGATRVLAATRRPAMLVSFNKDDGAMESRVPTCPDSDDMFVDAMRGRIYVSCGDGHVQAFERAGQGYRLIDALTTIAGARTSLWVPELDRLYLAVRESDGGEAAIWVIKPSR